MPKNTMLSEAIANAKLLEKVATEYAKDNIQEQFRPQLQSVISSRLQNEEDIPAEEAPATEVPAAVPAEAPVAAPAEAPVAAPAEVPAEVPATVPAEAPVAQSTEAPVDGQGSDAEIDLSDFEDAGGEQPTEEPTAESFSEFDVDAILRELDEEDIDDEDSYGEDNVDDYTVNEVGDDEEEEFDIPNEDGEEDLSGIDDEEAYQNAGEENVDDLDLTSDEEEDDDLELEAILREIELAETGEEVANDEDTQELAKENNELNERVKILTKDLNEHRKVVKLLSSKLNEVNLLNAKLLFTNRLFKANNLTNSQKMKVVESFDRAKSMREIKLLYTTLSESLTFGKTINETKRVKAPVTKITESIANAGGSSKPIASTKPSEKYLTENTNSIVSAEGAARLKKLAFGARKFK